jgi:trk system potassium uptake protein TrkA
MSLGDMMTLLNLRRGQYSLVEEKVPPGARAVGKAIKECSEILVIPRGDTTLQVGGEVLAIVDPDAAEVLAVLLGDPLRA